MQKPQPSSNSTDQDEQLRMHSHIDQIAKAVLYEGYLLYPYRPTSVKNQRRWTFGGVYPREFSDTQPGTDPWEMQTQCLIHNGASVLITVRFLHLIERVVGRLLKPATFWEERIEPALEIVPSLEIGERSYHPWQEAEEESWAKSISCENRTVVDLSSCTFSADRKLEPLKDGELFVGALIREQIKIQAEIETVSEPLGEGLHRISVRIRNVTPLGHLSNMDRESVLLSTMASTHTILQAESGELLSLTDTPEQWAEEAGRCVNTGTWPVLVGEEGEHHTILSSPIILYDYPKIAPESPGDLFDGTEIDEILTLRILTLTEEEKKEMQNVDARARALLQRTEALTDEELRNLHGAVRSLHPQLPEEPRLERAIVNGKEIKPGARVRLHPKRRADVFDLALEGKTATVVTLEQDFEDRIYVTVAVEEDPGNDYAIDGQPGHRFFFGLEEIEPLQDETS